MSRRPAEPSQLRKNGNQGVTPSKLDRSTMSRRPAEPSQLRKNDCNWRPRNFVNKEVELHKAENAWKPSVKASTLNHTEDAEQLKTEELLKKLRAILNKVTPEKFQQLVKQVKELTIDTEERLRGVADLIFERAISELRFSGVYASMCSSLMDLKVSSPDKPEMCVNFRTILLRQCQKEFEKIPKKPELEAAKAEEGDRSGKQFLRRSLGSIAFIGQLCRVKMLPTIIIHECVQRLFQNHDPVSLECLCKLLSLTGKALEVESAKDLMDQYFTRIYNLIQERKTSSRIYFMLQDVMDLMMANWIPRRPFEGPKPIERIQKDAPMEDTREHVKVQQQPRDGTTMNTGTCNPHTPVVNPRPTPPPSPSKSTLNAEVEKMSEVINDEYRHIEDVEEASESAGECNSASTPPPSGNSLVAQNEVPTGEQLSESVGECNSASTPPPSGNSLVAQNEVPTGEQLSESVGECNSASTLPPSGNSLVAQNEVPTGEQLSESVGECNSASTLPPSGNSLVAQNEVPTGEQLDRLLRDNADSEQIIRWIEANFEEAQITSNEFVRQVMTSVCHSVICHNPFRVDGQQMSLRANLLKKYLNDEQKQLQALYAIQAVVARMDHPGKLLRMVFDSLFDLDVIKEGAFYKWESSKEPTEQTGKDAALKSVKTFFVWLHDGDL
ncbi:eukaryotic translation initiation factor 4 gamma 1-like [Brachionichthys hirsutus]|uniref:eukaryotic translation initiation factor 4 gamma 1-like n=1 Tax=Brachionichthys hirsutus TaxID=412623 RepID=UPI003604BB95